MDDKTKKTPKCQWCGSSLEVNHTGTCPNCGKEGKIFKVAITVTGIGIVTVSWLRIREFSENNWTLLIILFILIILAAVSGYFLSGAIGALVSFIISIMTFFLGLKAITKVREIVERGS